MPESPSRWKLIRDIAVGTFIAAAGAVVGGWLLLKWPTAAALIEPPWVALRVTVGSTVDWFRAPTSVPRWLLLLIVVSLALLVRAVRRQRRDIDLVSAGFRDHVYRRHAPSLPEPPTEPEPDSVAEGFSPTPGQLALLRRASKAGGRMYVPFKEAIALLKAIDPDAVHDDAYRALSDLHAANAVRFAESNFPPGETHPTNGFRLTQGGRVYLRGLNESRRI